MVTMCCVHVTKITKINMMHSEMKNLFMKKLRKMVSDFYFPFDYMISSALFPKDCQHSTGDRIRELLQPHMKASTA